MCRHLGYIGPPITLHELIYAPPYSLHAQSYAPRFQRHGVVNADGFGVGWYDASRPNPVRYRRAVPIWADVSFADIAGVVSAQCVLAAVRSATEGFPVDESCAQPFTADRFLFSHNGRILDFDAAEEGLRAEGASGVKDGRAPLDSALLFAVAIRHWREGRSLAEGLAEVVRKAPPGRYNLLASDGTALAATAWGDSHYIRETDAVVIASEPFDDHPAWRSVPDGSLIIADKTGIHVKGDSWTGI